MAGEPLAGDGLMTTDLSAGLWQQNPDALIAFAHDGVVLQWNPAAEQIFGYPQVEAIGFSLFDLIVPRSRVDDERRMQSDALLH